MKKKNTDVNAQCICCDVDNCKYNDNSDKKCTLEEIKVKCNCDCAECKDDTICDSYREKEEE